jgi:hypothetical protein
MGRDPFISLDRGVERRRIGEILGKGVRVGVG